MLKLHEAIEAWKESPPYEGVRAAETEDIRDIEPETLAKIETILEAMEWPQLIIFNYSGSDRVVAPFAVGVSSEGNPLMRGYQIEGVSRSGKKDGWRIFQIRKMEKVENHQDFFNKDDFDFQEFYPWVYKVFKMLGERDARFERKLIEAAPLPTAVKVVVEEEKARSIFEELRLEIEKAGGLAEKDQAALDWLRKYLPEGKSTIGSPSTAIEHEAFTFDLEGIPIYFDDIEDAAVSLVREMVAGKKLPMALRSQIIGIQIVEEDARGGPDVVGMNDDGFITIFGNRQVDIGVIAHEASHQFAINKWGDHVPPVDSDYSRAIASGEKMPGKYAERNRGEDFAEAVRMFVVNPDELKRVSPRRYRVVKKLMEEKDYGG